jgi:hypothetical protein
MAQYKVAVKRILRKRKILKENVEILKVRRGKVRKNQIRTEEWLHHF